MNKEILFHKNRPTFDDWISLIFDDFIELHGDRCCGDDPAVRGGLALLKGRSVTIIGHAKGKNTKENIYRNFGMPHPEGYRKALRLMKQAEKFLRPVICFVDTAGAYCGIGAEERGQGEAIARNLMEMMNLNVPVLSVFTGEGGSGGALAMAVADKIYMLEDAIYSVISPRGCASILWKDPSREEEAAEKLKITAPDLAKIGIIDEIIAEHGGAHINPKLIAANIRNALIEGLSWADMNRAGLLSLRYERYRKFGRFHESV